MTLLVVEAIVATVVSLVTVVTVTVIKVATRTPMKSRTTVV